MEALLTIAAAFALSSLVTGTILWLTFRKPPSARWLDNNELINSKDYPTHENHRNRPRY